MTNQSDYSPPKNKTMRKSTIWACILSTLIAKNSAQQNQHQSETSGILHLSSANKNDIGSCHGCIVRAVSITQIQSLHSDSNNRIYWIEGSKHIARVFLTNCNIFFLCAFSTELSKSYLPDYFSITHRRDSTAVAHPKTVNYVEQSIFKWSKLVISQTYKRQTVEAEIYPEESHQEHNTYLGKQSRIFPALFFSEIGTEPILRSKNGHSTKAPGKQDEILTDLSIRCIYSYNRKRDAACRECLALHSKSLAIGTFYILFSALGKPSVELYVFTSAYESEYIIYKCKTRFCTALLPLESDVCQKLKSVFPSVRRFVDSQVVPAYSTHRNQNGNHIRITKNGLAPHLISRILNQVAARRFSRIRQGKELNEKDKQQLMIGLSIMTGKKPKCVMVTYIPNQWKLCITCVMRYTRNGARVIIDFSLTYATILTDREPYRQCTGSCRAIQLHQADDCSKHLQEHTLDIESHHRLLDSPYTNLLMSSCMLFYYTQARKNSCALCVRSTLNVKEQMHPTTPFSSVLDASDSSLKIIQEVFEQDTACHTPHGCSRRQQVPNRFCSEHRAYVGMTSYTQQTRKNTISSIHQLTKAKMSVGVWPPSSKRTGENEKGDDAPSEIRLTPFVTETKTSIWPSYSKIAFIEFASAPSKQLKCVGCLIQHSEVFFVYTDDDGSSGYVWMRQAPSHVFLQCLKTHCISLTYDDEKSQMERPIGLRPWTIEDLCLENKFE